ncbi:hypothetical protein DACRYDRAFT_23046 [Dacryopinax primogenitus]|uniref:Photolyase/cryptochrome alpha/beta domain-containing protein n=1 Tax=Dacryopinax primogenitus (strain DJM 731) TaxID=1858805 RepID=M5FSY6_DACPD|nr:uncharacterized protein DACRYDRAFT_23046 [Dacryopinax primogenitus]EJU00641.1 hypothetical protein DACRYDRAFT_23046 [Dacryopinax primogenitus]
MNTNKNGKRPAPASSSPNKRARTIHGHSDPPEVKDKIASASAAAAVDAHSPLSILERALDRRPPGKLEGECVVYWMRMEDMRLKDNRAFSLAASIALEGKLSLMTVFLFSPGDYEAHDRSPRRIDFMLRNLRSLRASLSSLDIPLYTASIEPRHSLPQKLVDLLQEYSAVTVCANMEYEVDELRRDERALRLALEKGIRCEFIHDKCIVQPGKVLTKQDKPYTVYSPFLRNWISVVQGDSATLECATPVKKNTVSLTPKLEDLLKNPTPIPEYIPGFECKDKEKMALYWPEGEDVASEVLRRFLHTKARKEQLGGGKGVLASGEVDDLKHSRIMEYGEGRNRADKDSSSRLSPYLASGVISARECLRQVLALSGRKKLEASNREDGAQMWTQEVAWRDFYTHVLAAFPRVSMGRPFLEKFNTVKWETDAKNLQAFKDGKTGYPIVDAAMRQCNEMGWMHNRSRMIAASFFVKDLMLDWRLGERYFMQSFIDGDLASNNGGWQWTASTGTDPQPYFRIFHPVSQAAKADPSGDYIRQFVPELSKLKGNVLYAPWEHMPHAEFEKLGYPAPIVDHKEARERALRRYKNPGCE